MPVFGSSTSSFVDQFTEALDANDTNSATVPLNIENISMVTWDTEASAGVHTAFQATLQCSFDGVNWINTTSVMTGLGQRENITIITAWVRVKITQAQGVTSTINVNIQGK